MKRSVTKSERIVIHGDIMEPKKKTRFIEVEYWDCGNDSHCHRTEAVAKRCIEKAANKISKPPKEVMYRRNIYAARAVINGETLKATGKDIGISSGRVREIVCKILSMSLHPSRNPGEPPCSHYELKDVRRHKEYWLARVDTIARHWGV